MRWVLRVGGFSGWKEQYYFAPGRKFHSDFAFPDRLLLIECEGGIWRRGGGAHSHPLNIERDIEKYNLASELGYRLFRVTDKMLAKKREPELITALQRQLQNL